MGRSKRKQTARLVDRHVAIMPVSRDWHPWLWMVIALVAIVAYANSLHGGFVFDDAHHILRNTRIKELWPLSQTLAGAKRPLVELSLAINFAIGGFSTFGYHVVNIGVHALAGIALFGVVRRTLLSARLRSRFEDRAHWLALVVALIWAVHPLQTQSVTYIIQRSEAMMGLFYMLTLYSVIRSADSKQREAWWAVAILACFCGMCSKTVMLTAPVVILVYDRIFLSTSWSAVTRQRKWLYLGLVASWSVLFFVGLAQNIFRTDAPAANVGFSTPGVSAWQYLLTQSEVIVHYLRLAIWPEPLCLDYLWPMAERLTDVWVEVAVVLVLLAAVGWCVWKRPAAGFVGFWFFAILAPTSSVIPIRDPVFEHRMYLPLASVVILMVFAFDGLLSAWIRRGNLAETSRRNVAGVLLLMVVAGCTAMTWARNAVYATDIIMWRDVVELYPSNGRAQYNLANALIKAGRTEEAVAEARKSVALRPDYAPSHYDLGLALQRKGLREEAMDLYRRAIKLDGDHADAHLNLGVLLRKGGRPDQAVDQYREVVRIAPDHYWGYYNMGNALVDAGRIGEAATAYRKAIQAHPNHDRAHVKLAKALVTQGKHDEAIREALVALRLKPGETDALFTLGMAFLKAGRPNDAAEAFQNTLRVQPNHRGAAAGLREAQAALSN